VTATALAIDIGATKISCAVVTATGDIRERAVGTTPRVGADVVAAVVGLIGRMASAASVRSVGVGSAGIIDPASGVVTGATSVLANWEGVRLRDDLEAALGLPVTIMNDIHAHAWGEKRFGAGASRDSVFVVAVGTGLGAVLATRRGIEPGAHGASGHFGHISCPEAGTEPCACGGRGHLESVASGLGVPALYRRLGGDRAVASAKEVFALVDADPVAAATVQHAATALGRAIGGAVNLLDPESVVLAGGMRDPGGPWLSLVDRSIRDVALPTLRGIPLAVAQLGDDAALVGAGHYALTRGGQNDL
jgi:glucokinase